MIQSPRLVRVSEPHAPTTVYRVVKENPPTERDFYSAAQMGRSIPPGADPDLRDSFTGVSVWDSESAAKAKAREIPKLGTYVAELRLPDSVVRRPFGPRGHWDVYADPEVLRLAVVRVVPVD